MAEHHRQVRITTSDKQASAACHVEVCTAPVVFTPYATANAMLRPAGFMVGKKAEAGGIAKDGAKMVMAVANVKVSTQLAHCSLGWELWLGGLLWGWLIEVAEGLAGGWLRVGCGVCLQSSESHISTSALCWHKAPQKSSRWPASWAAVP